MLDYSFYTGTYKGYIITSPDIFDRYKVKAEKYFERLDEIWIISYESDDDKYMAICAILDNLYENDSRSKGTVKSESDGSYSVTYGDNLNLDKFIMQEISYYVVVYRGGGC